MNREVQMVGTRARRSFHQCLGEAIDVAALGYPYDGSPEEKIAGMSELQTPIGKPCRYEP
jgi:hypothetical protein